MLSWTLLSFLAITPPTGFTASVERLRVARSGGEVTVKVEPLLARVVMTGAKLTGKPSQLCPKVERRGDTTTLHCRTRRLWAALAKDARGSYLDVRQLIGVSWLDADFIPVMGYAPSTFLLPDSCPGTLLAAQAECALARGDLSRAERLFTACLETPDLGLCHLRLGDFAARRGDVEAALQHWAMAPYNGPVARLARFRTCELMGTCLDVEGSARARSLDTLPPELHLEVKLAAVRRELAAGRDAEAMTLFVSMLEQAPTVCEGNQPLCQRLVWIGLQSDDAEARMGALSVFLQDRVRRGGAEHELNQLAAATATELGAPAFAASIISANTPRVPRAELPEHLLRVIELYLAAHDTVRAAVVFEYAEVKLGAVTQGVRWNAVRKALNHKTTLPPAETTVADSTAALAALSDDVSLSTDLARATKARSQAANPLTQPATPENAP